MHRRTRRGGGETLISRAISTQESGNHPYHVKMISSYLLKRVERGIISSSKRWKWHLRDSTLQNFPREGCPRIPYDVNGYAACRAD